MSNPPRSSSFAPRAGAQTATAEPPPAGGAAAQVTQGQALATPAVPPPRRSDFRPLSQVTSVAEALSHPDTLARFKAAAPKQANGERLLRMVYSAVMANQDLQDAPIWTLVRSALQFGALGIEPNSPLGHGYLIPFRTKKKLEIQSIIGYKGYIMLAANSGYKGWHADVVYRGDAFDYEYGTSKFLRHRLGGSRFGRPPEYAYAVIGEDFEVRVYEDVLKVRDQSSGYRAAVSARDNGRAWVYAENPWVKHEHPMAAKTMIRSAMRFVALTPEIAIAADLDARSEAGERADFRTMNTGMDLGFIEGLPEDVEDMSGSVRGANLDPDPRQEQRQHRHERRAEDPPRSTPDAPSGEQARSERGPLAKPDATTAGQRTETAQQSPAAPQQTAPTPTVDAAPEYFLTDADGFMVVIDEEPARYTNPTEFAAALEALIGRTRPESRIAVLEHNADDIEDASAASEGAKSILSRLSAETRAATKTTSPAETQASGETAEEERDLNIDFSRFKLRADYLGAVRSCLATLKNHDDVLRFAADNHPSFLALLAGNSATLRKIEVLLNARCAELQITPPMLPRAEAAKDANPSELPLGDPAPTPSDGEAK